MKRFGAVWLIFGLCVALAAGAMARLGATALALERAEAKARRQAALEENLQLALWRMDSALAPLMAEESARPYFAYSPLYPAERAFTAMFAEIRKGDVLMPSPLLTFTSPQIRLHFQYGPDGRLSSPQVPAGNMRDLAESRYLTPELIEQAARRLNELGKLVSRKDLAAALTVEEPAIMARTNSIVACELEPQSKSKSSNEYLMRSRSTKLAQNSQSAAGPAVIGAIDRASRAARGGLDRPRARSWRVACASRREPFSRAAGSTGTSSVAISWPAAADLLPNASLEPVPTPAPGSLAPARMLASIPARLVPGSVPGRAGAALVTGPALTLDRLGVPHTRRRVGRAWCSVVRFP